jgi:transglutaminase-like putative cysteine protease
VQHLVRHLTRFTYDRPVCESVMELRMQPLTDRRQRCLTFAVTTTPRARVFAYRDYLGNAVHYFDLPGHHSRLEITAEAAVEMQPYEAAPPAVEAGEWQAIDAAATTGEWLDWLRPSSFACESRALLEFEQELGLSPMRSRNEDPLTRLRRLMQMLKAGLTYQPKATLVDSPIDRSLERRAGVCQDFAHIMIVLVRRQGIPCRYVSGYLIPGDTAGRAPEPQAENSTHAWVEAHLPSLGWIGLDPTNNTMANDRHIAIAVGRDYQDVPPARGVFKGGAGSELGVAVSITKAGRRVSTDDLVPTVTWIAPGRSIEGRPSAAFQQQQQQQEEQQQQ